MNWVLLSVRQCSRLTGFGKNMDGSPALSSSWSGGGGGVHTHTARCVLGEDTGEAQERPFFSLRKTKEGFSEEVTDTDIFQEEQVTFQKEKEDISGKERRRYKVSFGWLWKSQNCVCEIASCWLCPQFRVYSVCMYMCLLDVERVLSDELSSLSGWGWGTMKRS